MTLRVIHSLPRWLQQTQTWIHTQVECVPPELVENHVVCEEVTNLDQFPFPRLHPFSATPAIERLWDRACRRLGARPYLGHVARTGRRLGARVLHSHFGDIGWQNIGAARAGRMRHVVTFYGYDVNFLPRQPGWHERLLALFRSVDLVLCEGPYMRRSLIDLGCDEAKVRVHHLGMRLDKMPFEPRAWHPGEALRILISAAFMEKKGIPYALEAIARLRPDVSLQVTIIGDARNVPSSLAEKQRILDTIRRHKLDALVDLRGFQPYAQLTAELYKHHVLMAASVVSSDGDTEGGAPVAVIEASAAGLLVVGSRHCDIPNVVIDRDTGYLAEEKDVDGLAACLRAAMQRHDVWPEMLRRARARIETEFDARQQGQRVAAFYRELADG